MINIIEIQIKESDSLFHKSLKEESDINHKLFVFQKANEANENIKYIPVIDLYKETAISIQNYFTAIARFISSLCINNRETVLIISNPIHLFVSQYLKTKLPLKLLLIASNHKENYFDKLNVNFKKLNKDKSLRQIINDAYIFADKIIYTKYELKKHLSKDLNISSNKLDFIEDIHDENSQLKSFFKQFIHQKTESNHIKHRSHYFHLKAKEVLFKAKEALEELEIRYWIDYGTLLGAVRENGFIGNDLDIDIGLLTTNNALEIAKKMTEKGFVKIAEYKLKDSHDIAEQTYILDNVHLDLFFYQKKGNKIYGHYFYSNASFEMAMEHHGGLDTMEVSFNFNGIDYTKFLGTTFPIPKKHISYLKEHYGENYLIPDKNWNYTTSPCNIKKIKTKGVVKY